MAFADALRLLLLLLCIFFGRAEQRRQRKFAVHWTNDMSARYATPRTPTNCGAELTAFAALMSGSYASRHLHRWRYTYKRTHSWATDDVDDAAEKPTTIAAKTTTSWRAGGEVFICARQSEIAACLKVCCIFCTFLLLPLRASEFAVVMCVSVRLCQFYAPFLSFCSPSHSLAGI